MRKLLGIGLLVLLASCASNPYRGSEKIYTKQVRGLSKDLKKKQINAFVDSAGNVQASQWVSTVNFNLRKPNYVIIHQWIRTDYLSLLIFSIGSGLGSAIALYGYAHFAQYIQEKFTLSTRLINHTIAILLFALALVLLVKQVLIYV